MLLHLSVLSPLQLRSDSPHIVEVHVWLHQVQVILVDFGHVSALSLAVAKFDLLRVSVFLFGVRAILHSAEKIDVSITV